MTREEPVVQLREAYGILGVSAHHGVTEIRMRYRRLVKEYHPDVTHRQGDTLARIIEAYRIVESATAGSRPRKTRGATGGRKERSSPPRGHSAAPAEGGGGDSARLVFQLGGVAMSGKGGAHRCDALRRLVHTGSRSAAVFVRQCLFDADKEVRHEAARLIPLVPGERRESMLIEVVDRLTSQQCVAMLKTIGRYKLPYRRFVGYAAADSRASVRNAALEVLRG